MKRNMLAAALALLLASGLARPAAAQEADLSAVKSGIDRLHALPGTVAAARSLLSNFSFGPYNFSGTCGYQCLGALCFMENHWNVSTSAFLWFKSALDRQLAAVSAQASAFDTAFAPVRQWFTGTLPQFSHFFDDAAGRLAEDAATISKGGDSASVAKANNDIEQTLAQVSANLLYGSNQLRGGVADLARFNQNLSFTLNQVQSLSTVLDNSISAGHQDIVQRTGGWPCGQGDAVGNFDGAANQVRAQFNSVVSRASATTATAQQSDKDLSLMLGTVLNIQTRYQTVLNQVRAAQVTPQGAVQTLRVNVAAAAWRDLAQYAVQQLGTAPKPPATALKW